MFSYILPHPLTLGNHIRYISKEYGVLRGDFILTSVVGYLEGTLY